MRDKKRRAFYGEWVLFYLAHVVVFVVGIKLVLMWVAR